MRLCKHADQSALAGPWSNSRIRAPSRRSVVNWRVAGNGSAARGPGAEAPVFTLRIVVKDNAGGCSFPETIPVTPVSWPERYKNIEPFEKGFDDNVRLWQTVGVKDLAPGGMMDDCKATLKDWLSGARRLDTLGARLRAVGMRLSYHNQTAGRVRRSTTPMPATNSW
jgi:hypothetical protein